MIENIWLASALWIALALISALISIRLALSVALIEIMVGAVGGNVIGLPLTPWVNYLAGLGAILLTFLAGAEVDMEVVRRNVGASIGIGFVSFLFPYLGCMLAARYLLDWDWPQAQIAGISLSTTSEIAPWFFAKVGRRVSEPEIKFLLLVLFALGGFATAVGSEAVLPAYVIGMALAPAFQRDPDLPHRMRVIAFAVLTPFYFLKAGSLVEAPTLVSGAGLIALFLGLKMATKFIGILPLTRYYQFENREGMYTTLLMSTGLTFGSISALYGLTNNIIDQRQYTILLTAVIASAVVPTVIAQRWFLPKIGAVKQEV